ncbi:hypothetical protein SAMN05216369_0104 [Marinobacter antarcticus]|uniref:Uncharacterized protein n=1 Tax=Marinobacter antarcticus TaxID=564117 RepID=A0A1M6P6H7_9GAMM|nr:hypothetical protein [Marinobacter antarcticus]SHK03510.1 hypothetical protein SAMN05216369_0104 [Marinobacter antarcticus]
MFQLVFKGECAPGTDMATARSNARALFKASVEQLERMFSGGTVVIRNKLDEEQAEKYRAVLNKHGMVAYVEPMPGTQAKPAPVAHPASTTPEPVPAKTVSRTASPQPRTGAPDVESGGRLSVAGDKVDDILAGSALGLDPVGVKLVETEEVEPPMFQHLDDWTLAPAGSDIGVERDLPPPIVPDVSHLSLVDEERDNK